MTDDSEIKSGPGGTTFAGPDAVRLYQATALRVALNSYARTKMQVNRAYTPTAMLKAAGRITGKTYKRGQHQQAADDLKIWADTMAAGLPISTSK